MSKPIHPLACPNLTSPFACSNRSQCFEPCGDLGHDPAHAKRAPKEIEDELTMRDLVHRAEKAEAEAAHWKANHETEVKRARILKDRPDMPVERVKAYEQIGDLLDECELWHELCVTTMRALAGPEAVLEDHKPGELIEVAALVKDDAQRFAACRHGAATMPEYGGEEAFIVAIDKYRAEHGI